MIATGGTINWPIISAANVPMFTCCLCTTMSPEGKIIEEPLYAFVFHCFGCLHTVCYFHRQTCGLCFACCAEEHGLATHKPKKPWQKRQHKQEGA